MSPVYAWPTWSEPWHLEVTDASFDGEPRPDAVDPARARIQAGDAPWSRLTLQVTVSPPATTGPEPAAVHLLVSAPRTQARWAVTLTRTGDAWSAEVELLRETVAGVVELTAEVTAEVSGRVRLVGSSGTWALVVDAGRAPAPPGAPPFDMVWLRFDDPSAPEAARQDPDVPAVLDVSGATNPVLYLNDSLPGLRLLLNADHARGARRMARDLVSTAVAARATTTLLRLAVDDVLAASDDDEPPVPPADPLRRQTLEAVAGMMHSVSDLADLCERIVAARSGPPAMYAALWSQIDAAVDRLCGVSAAVTEVAEVNRFE